MLVEVDLDLVDRLVAEVMLTPVQDFFLSLPWYTPSAADLPMRRGLQCYVVASSL